MVVLLRRLTNSLELPWFSNLDCNSILAVSFNDATDVPDKISFVYRSTRLPLFYVEHISSNFVHAVHQVIAHPHRPVNEIEVFSPLNQSAITQWNRKEHQPVPLLEVVSGYAKSRPDHAAICATDGTASYAELERLTTRWAIFLQTQGVGPECLVPVMMHHSKWAVIAELAILKAGGAFVPLDPAQPLARLVDIIQQCKARLAVSCDKHLEMLSSLVDTVVPISEGTTTDRLAVCLGHLTLVTSKRTAYVLFTSGSTGRPKGCVVSYEALSDVVHQTPALKIVPDSRVLQFASYTYGMSLIEIYCTLAAGATICIPSDHERLNALSYAIRSMEATWAILTPSTTMSITESADCLKTLVVAGEALTLDHVHALAEKVELIQAFGLTEWGGISCVSQPMSSGSDRRVIGRSPTAHLWLVDPNDSNKLAPVGAVAELLVQGLALADGYLRQPEKTAAVFLKDPLWLPPWATGSRLYRSGDLVQYTPNGHLRYISRKDAQVKIRGMRVELAEVEYQIRQAYSQLDQAIVEAAVPKGSNDILILVAFLHSKKKEDPERQTFLNMIETIRGFLALTLPEYMRPSVYVPLDSVPLTISRKVDRKALRQTIVTSTRKELERYQTVSALMISPQTDLQRLILELVGEVLRLGPLSFGLGHNFVSLGGDSVTAMLLVNKLRKHGYRVTVGPLLGAQTLSDIASLLQPRPRAVDEARQKTLSADAHFMVHTEANGYPTIPKLAHDGPVEQSFSQARIWFLQEMHADSTWLLLPNATRIRGKLQLEALNAALSAVVERQEALRTTFTSRNGAGLQVVAPFQPTPLKVMDMASSSNDELMSRLCQQQNTPMDLGKECWRVTLFRLSATDHVLSIVLHHIIADGWSFDIFVKSLAKYYNAIVQGRSPLDVDTPLPIQYRDFTVWQRQEKTSVHEEQLAYWERQLVGSHPLEFLCDKHRPSMLSGKAGWQPAKVDGSLYLDLQRFCRTHQVTPFSVLLAAFRAMHFRLTGVGDATIGIPAAARTRAELEGLIGYFGNVQCIRTMVESRDQSFHQLVDQVQSVTTAAFENQDVPFDQIVSRLTKDRDVSRHPLIQVTFVLHPQADFGRVRLDGLEMEPLHLPQVSRLDLEFHLYPADGFLRGDILYSEDLFHAATIQGMLSVFYDILREGLRQPNADLGSLPLTDGYDTLNRHGLIYPEPDPPSHVFSIISMFLQQVELHPEETAVRDIKTQLTYSELDQRSSILASWLTRQYSLPLETPIGVYAPRSCEGIVAYFGIMKAGLTYAPLDVDAPMERIEMILSCLPTCQLVLMGSDQTAPVVSAPSVKFAFIAQSLGDTAAANMPACLSSRPTSGGPTSLACILFTSGTTGRPKGVMMEQYGIVRLAKDPEIVAHVAASKVSSYLLNPVFDASGFDIYPALLNGGTLVCMDRNAVWDFTVLEEAFVKNEVRRAVMTPAMLSQCLSDAPGLVKALDILYVGGDKLDPADVAKARRCGGRKLQIFNCYGPTENSVISTRYAVPEDEVGVNGIPIGRAIVESGAYVMDRNLRLVPIGVLGELVVTGSGLARGYLDSEHNRNRFVAISIGNRSVRAYRTGDLVRYRPDDMQLEFFGRMDQQVKIRGHRVEPAEIDNVLLGDDLVTMAVTVVQKGGAQTGGELVSFVTVQESVQDIARLQAQIQNGHIDEWRDRADADDHYGSVDTIQPETLGRDFLGWVSMYNGEPIEEAEMTEWLNDTIAAIQRLEPRRVLEIGTGTGMVLFNLIGRLEQYFGLEPSSQAVRFVQNATGWVEGAAKKVNVQVGTAADIAGVKGAGPLDLAVINSVAQYFPSISYLRSVILDLINTQDVKCIFFGDIRSYALHREFQASKVLRLYGHTLTGLEFRKRMAEAAGSERELLVDPAFFTALAAELPDLIEHVEILPKRMKVTNELSCYRYGAILHVRQSGQPPLHVREVDRSLWIDFEMQGLNARSLAQLLKLAEHPSILAVSNIPYKKTMEERLLIDLLQNSAPGTSRAGWSREACKQAHACPALAAADLVDLALHTGWGVEISWARQGSQHGGLDAIFYRPAAAQRNGRLLFRFPTEPPQSSSLSVLSNNPLKLRRNGLIESQLRERLRAKLPSYMVPQLVRVLDQIPVNNVGKVDRKSLEQRNDISAPSAGTTTSGSASRQAASRFTNEAQRSLWEEFTSVLGVEVGMDDSFFDLGGHSLMAIKLISRINKRLRSSLRVSELFQYPTVARLGSRLQVTGGPPPSVLVNYTPFSLLDNDSLNSAQALDPSYLDEMRLPSGATIVDIFPVTECQAWLLKDWSLVSHTFTIHGDLDVTRFRSACEKTVQEHAVLRTVFTTLQGRSVQVICESVNAPFVQKTTGHAPGPGFTVDNEGDALTPTALTTRFSLVSDLGTKVHQFTLQLCHAQYDGPTLLSLLSDIACTYRASSSSPLASSLPFSHYLHASRAACAEESLGFWRNYLAGSSGLTAIPPSTQTVLANSYPVIETVQEVVGALPPLPSDVTLPTLVNAAIAVSLAAFTQSNDITFVCVMSSRDVLATLPAAQSHQAGVFGPCINRVLLRVQLPGSATESSARDFCRRLRDNQAHVSSKAELGLKDVVENCTNWLPPSTDCGAGQLLQETPFVLHLPADTATLPFSLTDDLDVAWKSTDVGIRPRNQVIVRSTAFTATDNELTARIQVQASRAVLSAEDASAFAARILRTIRLLSTTPEAPIQHMIHSDQHRQG